MLVFAAVCVQTRSAQQTVRVPGGMPPAGGGSSHGAAGSSRDARHSPLPWAVEQPSTRSEFDRAVRELVRREADVEVRILEYVRHREHT